MHVFPARVITPTVVWYPVTAVENAATGELYVDARHGEWRHTLAKAEIALAPEDVRAARNTERLWLVSGEADGEPTTWAVEYARGCGCGSTRTTEPNAEQLALINNQ